MNAKKSIPKEALTAFQQTFIAKLRWHDQKVEIFERDGVLYFRGAVVGEGQVPSPAPIETEPR